MFIINRCFKNIWLESQMIHVALFSFQRTTLSFEALASSDSFIVPHLFQTVKNFFIFLFVWVIRSSKALPIKEHFLARPVSRGDLYYITGWWCICQHLFLKNCKVFWAPAVKQKTHRLLDASYWLLVAAQRFELRTLRVWTACSSQLSYAAMYEWSW